MSKEILIRNKVIKNLYDMLGEMMNITLLMRMTPFVYDRFLKVQEKYNAMRTDIDSLITEEL